MVLEVFTEKHNSEIWILVLFCGINFNVLRLYYHFIFVLFKSVSTNYLTDIPKMVFTVSSAINRRILKNSESPAEDLLSFSCNLIVYGCNKQQDFRIVLLEMVA